MPLKLGLDTLIFLVVLLSGAPKSNAFVLSLILFEFSVIFSLQLEFSAVLLHSVVLVYVELDCSVEFVELESYVVLVEFNT
jgi:hypothetical protein